jgi:hypothetical protein
MTWIATAQIVLPQLPVTEFEQSGRLNGARRSMKRAALLGPWYPSINVALIFLFPGWPRCGTIGRGSSSS